MFPFYQNMSTHSYPSQRNNACCGQQHHPGWGAIPQHTQMDQHINSMNIGPWLHPGSHVHSIPTGYHGCCSHNPAFGYCSNGVSYCYHPLPPSMPAPLSCQPYTDYRGYATAPPHFMPPGAVQYYGKPAGKEQCCSCPNHSCNGKVNAGPKIEEQVPETAQKMDSQLSRPEFSGFPHPMVWIPEYYDKKEENTHEPTFKSWNGWHPVDLQQMLQPNSSGKEDRPQSPFPVFLLPGSRNTMNDKEVCPTADSAMERDPRFKVIPLRFLESDKRGHNLDLVEGELVDKVEVKPSGEPQGNGPMAGAQEPLKQAGGDCVAMKQTKDEKNIQSRCEEVVKKDKKRQSLSPVKAAKLPPVCLRADPLPKKRNGNGLSRSASPPSGKGRAVQDKRNEVDIEKIVKVIEVEEKEPMACDFEVSKRSEMGTLKAYEKDSGAAVNETKEIKVTNSAEQVLKESRLNDKCKENASECSTGLIGESLDAVKKLLLSEEDAAMRIQSAYRGFEVRRWDPVKKLKQIAKIKGQVKDVNNKMCELEANGLLQVDEKQRAIMNENIMCLLLQLDTIQSIHPSVRGVRKSVAKELICLQENLDSITQTAGKNMVEAESKINEDVNFRRSLSLLEESTVVQDEEFVKRESDVTTSILLPSSVLREESVGELPSTENQADEDKPLGDEERPSSPQEKLPNIINSVDHLLLALDPTNQDISTKPSEIELPYDDGLQELSSLECLEIGEEWSTAVGEQAPVILPAATDVKAVEDILEEAAHQSAQEYEAVKLINDDDHLVGSEPNAIANDVEENNPGPDQSDELERPLVEKFVVVEHDRLEAVVESNDAGKSNSETEEAASEMMPDALNNYIIENVVSKNLGSDATQRDMPLGDEENCMSEVSSSEAEAAGGNTGVEAKEATPSFYLGAEQVNDHESEATDHEESPNDEFAPPMTLDQCPVTSACTDADKLTVTKDSEINKSGENTLVDSAAPSAQSQAMDDDTDQLNGPIKIIEPVASVEESLAVNGKYLVEENEKLRKLVESLVVAGKEQLSATGELSGRVRELEKQLAKKRRLKLRNYKRWHGTSTGIAGEESLTNISSCVPFIYA